jgi:uncharacterized protein (TIGR03067 family)
MEALMFRLRFAPLTAALALFVTSAPSLAQDEDPAAAERAKFAGTWAIVSGEQDGQRIPVAAFEGQTLVFDGDRYYVKRNGETIEQGTFVVDPTKSPRTIELRIEQGKDKDQSQVGIYRLEGDSLRIAFARAGEKERPARFMTEPDSETFIVELERQSDAKP